jgi:hypothetical protein
VQPGALAPPAIPAEPPRTFTPAASPPLRRALEQAWLAHVIAIRSGKEGELERTMSSYYFVTTKNRIGRGSALTPDHLALYGKFLPDLNRTRFVSTIEKGPTAALVHEQDATLADGSNEPRVQYFFFRFENEGRGWKVDDFAMINAPKYRADGSLAPFSLPANPSPVYRIDGQIRPAPPLLSNGQ